MELRKLLDILIRRRWIILQTALIVAITAIVVTYLIRPNYMAVSSVLITSQSSQQMVLDVLPQALRDSSGGQVENEIQIIKSPLILLKVRDKIQAVSQEYGLVGKIRPKSPPIYHQEGIVYVDVEQVSRQSDVIEISVYALSSKLAAEIANMIVDVYQEEKQSYEQYSYSKVLDLINRQIPNIKSTVEQTAEALKQFQEQRRRLYLLIRRSKPLSGKISELMTESEEDKIHEQAIKAEVASLKDQIKTLQANYELPNEGFTKSRVCPSGTA